MKAGPRLPDHLFALRERYVTLAGEVAQVAIETNPDPDKIDHVWITVRAGEAGRAQISLSTYSRPSRAAGFDPRIRLGLVAESWDALPPAGIRAAPPFSYAEFEASHPTDFRPFERETIEQLIIAKARRAIFVEAVGDLYLRAQVGIHQLHSRAASSAIPREVQGRDGWIRFFFPDGQSELLLFKFHGQP